MKLKLFAVFVGATLGWVLPPDNYTNPCEDFQEQFKNEIVAISSETVYLNYKRYREQHFSRERQ